MGDAPVTLPEVPFFPKVAHLARALVDEAEVFVPGAFGASEKLDGANAGVARVGDVLVAHSRRVVLAGVERDGTLRPAGDGKVNTLRGFLDHVRRNAAALFDAMPNGTHLYGEWLVPHTLVYPVDMLHQWYLFPPRVGLGEWDALERLVEGGVARRVPMLTARTYIEPGGGMDEALALLERYAQGVKEREGREVEGLVFSRGARRYKLVRPEFQEDAKRKWGPASKRPRAPGEVEAALAASYRARSYRKVVEHVQDALERPVGHKDIPRVLETAWTDFAQEFLPDGLRRLRWPTVNTHELRKLLVDRVRGMLLSELETGALPQWALHGEDAA